MSQPMQALQRANEVRTAVSRLRRDLSAGRLLFCDLDLDDPDLQGIRISHLLTALPWQTTPRKDRQYVSTNYHRKADRLLHDFGISDRLRVGALSNVRKQELKRLVTERCPSQRERASA